MAAIRREKEIKGWLRIKKIRLIEESNPEWKDLYPKIHQKQKNGSVKCLVNGCHQRMIQNNIWRIIVILPVQESETKVIRQAEMHSSPQNDRAPN